MTTTNSTMKKVYNFGKPTYSGNLKLTLGILASILLVSTVSASSVITDQQIETDKLDVKTGLLSDLDFKNNAGIAAGELNEVLYVEKGNASDIQPTIDRARSLGGAKVVIPSGKYWINSEINITEANNTHIQGHGPSTNLVHNNTESVFRAEEGVKNLEISRLKFSAEYSDAVIDKSRNIRIGPNGNAGNHNWAPKNIKIHDLVMEYPSANHTAGSTEEYAPAFGIQLNSVENGVIRDNRLVNFGWYPLEIERGSGIVVENNYIRTGYYGLSGGAGVNDITYRDNKILPATNKEGYTYGVYLEHAGGNVNLDGNFIKNASGSAGIRLSNTVANPGADVQVSNNLIENSDDPVRVDDQGVVQFYNNIIPDYQGGNTLRFRNNTKLHKFGNALNDGLTFDLSNTDLASSNFGNSLIETTSNVKIGNGFSKEAETGTHNVIIGHDVDKEDTTNDGVIIGNQASGSENSVSIGVKSQSDSRGVAIGVRANVSDDLGSTAIGRDSKATGTSSVAIGRGAKAEGSAAIALRGNANNPNEINLGYDHYTNHSGDAHFNDNDIKDVNAVDGGGDDVIYKDNLQLDTPSGGESFALEFRDLDYGEGAIQQMENGKFKIKVRDGGYSERIVMPRETSRVDIKNADLNMTGNSIKNSKLFGLKESNLPSCESSTNGNIGRNQSDNELYYCDNADGGWEQITP